jgi:UDP:flavonoid glycosyltransferase YjiC (YdhE family)
MSRITLAWEQGEGYGHVSRLLPVARLLRDRGHEVSLVAIRLREAGRVFGEDGFRMLQAPMYWRDAGGKKDTKTPNYAGILVQKGYSSTERLRAIFVGWRDTLEMLRADLVLCDHSPTALLAARTLGIHRATISSGFGCPPRTTPLPEMLPWNPSPKREHVALEGRALATINTVLKDEGESPVVSLADFFESDADFLCTFPDLDHYGTRQDGLYCGPIIGSFGTEEPVWPDAKGKRIFVYIKKSAWNYGTVMTEITGLGLPILAHIGGMEEAEAEKHSNATTRVSARPYDLTRAVETCDLVVSPCGHGTVVSTLLAGRPMLMLSQHPEQRLLAGRVEQMSAGLVTGYPKGKKYDYAGTARRLLDERGFTKNARAFAHRHASYDPKKTVTKVADGIEAILRS